MILSGKSGASASDTCKHSLKVPENAEIEKKNLGINF